MDEISQLQREIIKTLRDKSSSYAKPVSSDEIGRLLNVNPSYVREQMGPLQNQGWVMVRNGPGGGYFLSQSNGEALDELLR